MLKQEEFIRSMMSLSSLMGVPSFVSLVSFVSLASLEVSWRSNLLLFLVSCFGFDDFEGFFVDVLPLKVTLFSRYFGVLWRKERFLRMEPTSLRSDSCWLSSDS